MVLFFQGELELSFPLPEAGIGFHLGLEGCEESTGLSGCVSGVGSWGCVKNTNSRSVSTPWFAFSAGLAHFHNLLLFPDL